MTNFAAARAAADNFGNNERERTMKTAIYLQDFGNEPVVEAYTALDEAMNVAKSDFRRHAGRRLDSDDDVQLGIYIDDTNGKRYYHVSAGHDGDAGTNCTLGDVRTWRNWWDDHWTDRFDRRRVRIQRDD